MPLPVRPSLQPLRRLRSLPSGVTGPRERRPLARLASARAVLVFGPVLVFVIMSVGSASAAVIGGSSSRCNGAVVVSRGLSAPARNPASSPDDAILSCQSGKSSGARSGIDLTVRDRPSHPRRGPDRDEPDAFYPIAPPLGRMQAAPRRAPAWSQPAGKLAGCLVSARSALSDNR